MVLVVFATNLKPRDLVDEAFLRRVQFKVLAESPTFEDFERIFENCCRERALAYEPALARHVVDRFLRAAQHPAARLSPARPDRPGAGLRGLFGPAPRADDRAARGRLRQLLRRRRRRPPDPALNGMNAARSRVARVCVRGRGGRGRRARRRPRARAFRITSPLGRTGLSGTIRIVARLDAADDKAPQRVDFLVDQVPLASDTDGPPYEALWVDENPFERRELSARAVFESGPALTDTVVLDPMSVTEVTEVTSVALDTSVLNAKGQFVRGLTAANFTVSENDDPQGIDVVTQRREPALFAVLVDSSQSMAYRADGLRAAARKLLEPLAPDDEVLVAPFSKQDPARHRADHRPPDGARGDRQHQACRGHGDPRRAAGSGRAPGQPGPAARHRAADRRLRRAQPGGIRRDGGGAAQRRGDALRHRRRRHRRHVAQGREPVDGAGDDHRRPRLVSARFAAACVRLRGGGGRRPASLPADLHAHEPAAGRSLPRDPRERRRRLHGTHPRRLHRAGARRRCARCWSSRRSPAAGRRCR